MTTYLAEIVFDQAIKIKDEMDRNGWPLKRVITEYVKLYHPGDARHLNVLNHDPLAF